MIEGSQSPEEKGMDSDFQVDPLGQFLSIGNVFWWLTVYNVLFTDVDDDGGNGSDDINLNSSDSESGMCV